MYLNRTLPSNLLQVCSFKGCDELCWLCMVPATRICQQNLFPALLVVKFLAGHQETKSSADLNQKL